MLVTRSIRTYSQKPYSTITVIETLIATLIVALKEPVKEPYSPLRTTRLGPVVRHKPNPRSGRQNGIELAPDEEMIKDTDYMV